MAEKRGRPASSVDHRSAAADWKQRREEAQRNEQEGKVALLDALEEESTAQVPRDEHQNTNLRSSTHTQPPRHQIHTTYPAQAMPFALGEAVPQATFNSNRLTNTAHGSTATQEAAYNQHFDPYDQTAFSQLRHYAASQQLFWQTQAARSQPQFANFQPPPLKAPYQSHHGQAPEGGVWLPPSPLTGAPLQWGGVRPGFSALNAGAAPYQPHKSASLAQGYHGDHSARVNKQYRTYRDNSTRASTPSEPSSSEKLNGPVETPAQPSFSRSDEPFSPRKGSKSSTRRGNTPADSRPAVTPLPVPKPTATYLSQASQEPLRLASPRPLLIIIDLNGTLIHRSKNRPTSFKARPHVPDFLSYLVANYTCLVWSSAQPQNVKALCAQLFTLAQRAQLIGEWGRDTLGLNKLQYSNKVQVYKQLDRWVWANEKVAQSHPQAAQGRRWTQRNTILIDDSEVKATSEPHNLVQIDEFEGKKEQMATDVLSQVVGYLEEARWQVDVSAFIRSRPFKFGGGWKSDWSRISGM
ncbi:NLI interacting factor-like phosphatase-domain-containing protein [Cryomyces antarcticus]